MDVIEHQGVSGMLLSQPNIHAKTRQDVNLTWKPISWYSTTSDNEPVKL